MWLGTPNMTSDGAWDAISLLPYNGDAEALALQHLKVGGQASCTQGSCKASRLS